MSWFKQLNSLTQIPDRKYEGYLWLSDKDAPYEIEKYDFTNYEDEKKPVNPFIREAYLYDSEEEISVSIKHLPGNYLIHSFNLKELSKDIKTKDIEFLSHNNLPGKLKFKEIWLAEKEENCENFEVLKKRAVVFTGFKREGEK